MDSSYTFIKIKSHDEEAKLWDTHMNTSMMRGSPLKLGIPACHSLRSRVHMEPLGTNG